MFSAVGFHENFSVFWVFTSTSRHGARLGYTAIGGSSIRVGGDGKVVAAMGIFWVGEGKGIKKKKKWDFRLISDCWQVGADNKRLHMMVARKSWEGDGSEKTVRGKENEFFEKSKKLKEMETCLSLIAMSCHLSLL